LLLILAGCASHPQQPPAAEPAAVAEPAAIPEPPLLTAEEAKAQGLGAPFATKYARFQPVAFDALPGWTIDPQDQSVAAFRQSCQALRKKTVWTDICRRSAALSPKNPDAAREFFVQNFYAYQVMEPNNSADGVITGYYEPLLQGSRTRTARFSYPVYGVPSDLLYVDAKAVTGAALQTFRLVDRKLIPADPGTPGAREYAMQLDDATAGVRDKKFRVRIENGTVMPYYTRQDLEGRDVRAQVFAWVDDPYALYSMQVQGSGKIQLPSGELLRVAYAEQNGHPFLPRGSTEDVASVATAAKTRGLKIASDDGAASVVSPSAGKPTAASTPAVQNKDVASIIASLKGTGSRPTASTPAATQPVAYAPPPQTPVPAAKPVSGDIAAMIAALKKPGGSPAAATSSPVSTMSTPTAATVDPAAGSTSGARTEIPDPSYVFFRRIPDGPEGPLGALGVPLTAGRSIAVDPRTTPLGYPVFLSTDAPGNAPGGTDGKVNRLMFAQDTGGAIRGAVRADFFWGFGNDAGAMASTMKNAGRMWLLIPKMLDIAAMNPAVRTRGPGGLSTAECVIPDDENCVEE
jgi:membrane-bound lytic murein transglycosylase A